MIHALSFELIVAEIVRAFAGRSRAVRVWLALAFCFRICVAISATCIYKKYAAQMVENASQISI